MIDKVIGPLYDLVGAKYPLLSLLLVIVITATLAGSAAGLYWHSLGKEHDKKQALQRTPAIADMSNFQLSQSAIGLATEIRKLTFGMNAARESQLFEEWSDLKQKRLAAKTQDELKAIMVEASKRRDAELKKILEISSGGMDQFKQEYHLRSRLIRDEILRRLPQDQIQSDQNTIASSSYTHPINDFDLLAISDDLERLAETLKRSVNP